MALLIPWLLAWCLVAALAPAARAQRAPQLPKKEAFDPPPIDRSAQTQLFAATSFLYTGRSAVQVGVAPGTIKEERVALIRGRVVDALGKGVASVRIAVEGHAEFGETKTREDGQYDLAVNGGGALVLDFSLSGYIPVHRRVESAWQEYVPVENVILTRLDPVVTHVDLSQTAQPFVVASGSVRSDASGTRQSRLLFARNTTAQLRLPTGTTHPIGNLAVHATEFTVGTGGPAAMPADLPDSSAYTYAVDFAVEQAMQAGATGVEFTQPVINYVENFIGFSVGTPVPCGRRSAHARCSRARWSSWPVRWTDCRCDDESG
ncbi:MAG: hypothetical protein IT456_18605 [Planctomycetes bacterium]|nr:hypothetical protein [Planctomycetota bacterium]